LGSFIKKTNYKREYFRADGKTNSVEPMSVLSHGIDMTKTLTATELIIAINATIPSFVSEFVIPTSENYC
jgi:hypothetical protein